MPLCFLTKCQTADQSNHEIWKHMGCKVHILEENKSDYSSDISDLEFVTEEQMLLDNARDDDEIWSLYRRLVAEGKARAIRLQAITLKVVPEKKRNDR